MDNKTTRILIETIVKKAIKDMDDAPRRSVRNLVDMALQFSKGRFQRDFFQAAQTMLKEKVSAYYPLVQDIVSHVDFDHLITFGMGVGYNSCTAGAKRIREIEEKDGHNIPWSVMLHIDEQNYASHIQTYDMRIREGESLGIHTWQIIYDGQSFVFDSLFKHHPDSAFLLFCQPEYLSEAFVAEAAQHKNLMLVLACTDAAPQCCLWMRKYHLPYSFYYVYDEKDLPLIESGEIFDTAEQYHPIFTALQGESSLSLSQREDVYRQIKAFRDAQNYQTVPWELTFDSCHIDSIISDDACTASFDKKGYLHTLQRQYDNDENNLFLHDLKSIFTKSLKKQLFLHEQ